MEHLGRLDRLKAKNLGLERGLLRLEPHNPAWKRAFSDEGIEIYQRLRLESLRLFHCGSTAVPAMPSKPILDVLGVVESLGELDFHQRRLIDAGYAAKGEHGIPGRRYFVLSDPRDGREYNHLHFFASGDPQVARHLEFRDRLRADLALAGDYLRAKTDYTERPGATRDGYTAAKAPIIDRLLARSTTSDSRPRRVVAILGAAEGHRHTLEFLRERHAADDLSLVDLSRDQIEAYSYHRAPARDGFLKVMERAVDADLIVLATPVYWYTLSAGLKNFLDRLSDLLGGEHRSLGERLYGRRLRMLATGADPHPPFGFTAPVAATCIYFGVDFQGLDYRVSK